jgi:phosphohistidine phosphatase SixA
MTENAGCAACLGGPVDTFGRINKPASSASARRTAISPAAWATRNRRCFLASPAEIVSEALKVNKDDVALLYELANNASTASLLKALRPYASCGEILLVGHMPSLSEHLAVLIGAPNGRAFPLGKAGVACIELAHLRAGAGQLRWLMRQKQLQEISKR